MNVYDLFFMIPRVLIWVSVIIGLLGFIVYFIDMLVDLCEVLFYE